MKRLKRLIVHRQAVVNNLTTGPWLKGNRHKLQAVPVNTVAPSISGTPSPTNVLQCNVGTWENVTSYEFAWYADGIYITGADTNQYMVMLGDVGKTIRCDVTGINGSLTAVAQSNEVVIV